MNIELGAFNNCKNLTSVYISDIEAWLKISFDGGYANPNYYNGAHFYLNNELLTTVIIPESTTNVGEYVFYNCDTLTSVIIGDSVTSIDNNAFYNCDALTSVTIGNGITIIGTWAFSHCTSLMSITFNGTIEQWNALEKGSKWDYNTGTYTIYCTDGEIAKDGTVTYY